MKNVFFAFLLLSTTFIEAFGDGNSSSVLTSGDWYKISVASDGIYRITYSELRNLGIADPANVRIYGSGGSMLPEKADENFGDDLKEIPVWMYTGSDGIFNEGDYVLFYGQGPVVWRYNTEKQEFEHSLHLWDNRSYYFVTSRAGGKRIETENSPQTVKTQTVTSFDEHLYHEEELENLLKSGRYWYGEHFYGNSVNNTNLSRNITFNVPDIDPGVPARMNVSFAARSGSRSYFEIDYGNNRIANEALPVIGGFQYASEVSFNTGAFNPASENISVKLTLNQNGNVGAEGWLNYLRLYARRKLNMASSQLFFRDTRSVGSGEISEFQITNGAANMQVWDITDMHDIKRMNAAPAGSTMSFIAATDGLREFVAFNPTSGLLKPTFPEKNDRLDNQDLHGIDDADMIIVTNSDFGDAARRLADLHREKDGLTVEAVTAAQVYNEFSSGMQDPTAIRNFMKYLYEKSSTSRLKYLLLMGDGSYDNKSNLIKNGSASSNTNFMVTYQSENSVHSTDSYVSDDFFGILSNTGGPTESGKLDIGVGRLPVQTLQQAQDMVDKIGRYINLEKEGDWQNLIGLLADDEDGNLHTYQSEYLADYVAGNHPQYTIDKLYFDAFPQSITADGHRYPEVEQRLNDLLNKGCLLVNYVGHGNETGLSEERVVNMTSIGRWKNKIYPLFVVATCEFGRYDDYTKVTAGENLVLSPQGGGIALLTGTRLVYSSDNFDLNSRFFEELLTVPFEGDEHRLGDILRRAKNASGPRINKLSFTLLGDPALKPPVPSDSVQTLSINGKMITEPLDTLKANGTVTVKARITGRSGETVTDFNGVAHFTLFDKPRESKTLDNDGTTQAISFPTQNSVLYKGKATVKNGEFEFSFIMPRDINYQYGFGKFTYYAYSDNGATAAGAFDKIPVGGSEPALDDITGPEIRLFMNDTLFRDGGITDQNPKLIAYLRDETGINTSDEGIGHGITAVLNNNPGIVYYLNPYYEAALDKHNEGTVTYRFSDLPVGNYELIFSARDINNNLSQASIRFCVTLSSILKITNLHNYPNPFSDQTNIYFEYNMPDVTVEVELQIFDMIGRQLRNIRQSLISPGYTSGQFQWDGRDAGGNAMKNGIYPYRVILRTSKGQTVMQASKMVLMR